MIVIVYESEVMQSNFHQVQQPKFYDRPSFLCFGSLILFLLIVAAVGFAHKASESSTRAKIELEKKAWAACGKPFGKPCDCVPGTCKCGIYKGYHCANCRPMN